MWGSFEGSIAGMLSSNACFVAGTVILTNVGKIAIETIEEGMLVWAKNTETGEEGFKEVLKTFENETDELVHLFVGGEEIITTPEHPFYVKDKGFIGAIHLRAGDILVLVNGEYAILEKVQHEILEAPIKVYNFEVEGYHTYFVGDCAVLVHNVCSGTYHKNGTFVEGEGHGPNDWHRISINNKRDELAASGMYSKISVNRSLKTNGLNGSQRPDIIAFRKDGVIEIYEFASPSQASGYAQNKLVKKMDTMKNNNQGSEGILYKWGEY